MSCRKILPVVSRQFSTTTKRQADVIHPGYKKLRADQELFQKEDGLPVHVKKGVLDNILYKFTLGLGVFGVAASLATIYRMAFGKKN